MAKNIQRTYSSIRDYKKKNIKTDGGDDFEKLKNGQSDFSDSRRTVTTNNWSRDTFKSDQTGTKRLGSQSPLKLARENCKRKRTVEISSSNILDVYDFSADDDISDSNSCPPSLSAPSAISSSSDEVDTVLSNPQSSSLRKKTSKSRNSTIKYDLTFINHNVPLVKPSLRHTTCSPTKDLQSSQKPSTSCQPKLVKASSWPKSQPLPKQNALVVEKSQKDKVDVVTIANVKQAYQCKEHGEQQKFVDEMKYIMSNLNKSRSEMIRCLR